MTGPVHARGASALAAAGAQMQQIVPAQDAAAQPSAERAAESKANVR
jgi:hypothetical protein